MDCEISASTHVAGVVRASTRAEAFPVIFIATGPLIGPGLRDGAAATQAATRLESTAGRRRLYSPTSMNATAPSYR